MARFALRPRLARASAALGAAGLATLLVAAPAHAAGAPAPGTNLLTNGTLDQVGSDGQTPAGWAGVNLDNETAPFAASFADTSSFPPPSGTPNASGNAPEIFYEAGSSTGYEGFGGQQTSATFGSVTQADDPQVSYAVAPTHVPSVSVATWAGSIFQVDLTSGSQRYMLRYYTPWGGVDGTFSDAPVNTATTHYITTGAPISKGTWSSVAPRDLNNDLKTSFGLTNYTVNDVVIGELENTSSSGSPYPNMTSYATNVDLIEGTNTTTPPAATPEAPLAVGLPLAAVAVAGGAVVIKRRRRRA